MRELGRPVPLGLVTSLVLVVVVYGPLLSPGYVLVGDMVFTPDTPWKASYLGLDGGLPRAVPTDALVWLLTTVLPGWLVQRLLLVGGVVVAVLGVQRLLHDSPAIARVAASVAFVWAPYTHDRLGIGQWSLLVSVAFLPWVVLAARAYGARTRGWPPLLLALTAAAVFSPSGGVIAAVVAVLVVVCGERARRRVVIAGALGLLANVPWLLPGLLAGGVTTGGRAAVEGFAARGESDLGVVVSVLTGGGIWKSSVTAAERAVPLVLLVSLLLTVIGLVGALRHRRRETDGLAVAAALGVALCLLTAWAPGVVVPLVEAVPGLGILRDTTRYLAPLVLLVALGLGRVVEWLWGLADGGVRVLGVLVVAAQVVVLPSLAWGLLGQLRPVDYPPDWYEVRRALEAEPLQGPLVVLPWEGTYRRFSWNADRAGLDPAPRFFPGEVLLDDRVFLDSEPLPAEEERSRRIATALASPDPGAGLQALGIGGVLVQRDTPSGAQPVPLVPVQRFGDLDLFRLPHGKITASDPTREVFVLIGQGLLVSTCGMSLLVGRRDDRYTHH